MCNKALAEFSSDARIDHRSNEARGIETAPQPKVGAKSWHLFRRTGEKNERFKRWEEVMGSNRPILIDAARIELNKLTERKSQLTESRRLIRHQLSELDSNAPVIRTRDKIITDLLPNTPSGQKALSAVNESSRNLKAAQQRYDDYCRIMDAPLSFSNIRSKFVCWLNHATRAGERDRLAEAKQSFTNARQNARDLLKRAKASPVMHARVKPVMEAEHKKLNDWQQNVDRYNQRLSEIDECLQATNASLKLLRQKYPEIRQRYDWKVESPHLELALPQYEAAPLSVPSDRGLPVPHGQAVLPPPGSLR